jgi:hypothetical protein
MAKNGWMASRALITNCPNESGASWRSKAPANSCKPIKLSKPATVISTIRSLTRAVGGTALTVTAGVKLDEFDDTSTSSDFSDSYRTSRRTRAASFDHLIGAGE